MSATPEGSPESSQKLTVAKVLSEGVGPNGTSHTTPLKNSNENGHAGPGEKDIVSHPMMKLDSLSMAWRDQRQERAARNSKKGDSRWGSVRRAFADGMYSEIKSKSHNSRWNSVLKTILSGELHVGGENGNRDGAKSPVKVVQLGQRFEGSSPLLRAVTSLVKKNDDSFQLDGDVISASSTRLRSVSPADDKDMSLLAVSLDLIKEIEGLDAEIEHLVQVGKELGDLYKSVADEKHTEDDGWVVAAEEIKAEMRACERETRLLLATRASGERELEEILRNDLEQLNKTTALPSSAAKIKFAPPSPNAEAQAPLPHPNGTFIQPFPALQLPTAALVAMVKHLGLEDLAACARSCKALRAIVCEEEVWDQLLSKQLGPYRPESISMYVDGVLKGFKWPSGSLSRRWLYYAVACAAEYRGLYASVVSCRVLPNPHLEDSRARPHYLLGGPADHYAESDTDIFSSQNRRLYVDNEYVRAVPMINDVVLYNSMTHPIAYKWKVSGGARFSVKPARGLVFPKQRVVVSVKRQIGDTLAADTGAEKIVLDWCVLMPRDLQLSMHKVVEAKAREKALIRYTFLPTLEAPPQDNASKRRLVVPTEFGGVPSTAVLGDTINTLRLPWKKGKVIPLEALKKPAADILQLCGVDATTDAKRRKSAAGSLGGNVPLSPADSTVSAQETTPPDKKTARSKSVKVESKTASIAKPLTPRWRSLRRLSSTSSMVEVDPDSPGTPPFKRTSLTSMRSNSRASLSSEASSKRVSVSEKKDSGRKWMAVLLTLLLIAIGGYYGLVSGTISPASVGLDSSTTTEMEGFVEKYNVREEGIAAKEKEKGFDRATEETREPDIRRTESEHTHVSGQADGRDGLTDGIDEDGVECNESDDAPVVVPEVAGPSEDSDEAFAGSTQRISNNRITIDYDGSQD